MRAYIFHHSTINISATSEALPASLSCNTVDNVFVQRIEWTFPNRMCKYNTYLQ